jgi:hypothetical protein
MQEISNIFKTYVQCLGKVFQLMPRKIRQQEVQQKNCQKIAKSNTNTLIRR